jgi:ferric-dicitrate binding protein FerR (iron transport regulator)
MVTFFHLFKIVKNGGVAMKRILMLTVMLVLALQVAVFAAVTVNNRTGAIKITMPDGTFVVVAADQALPVIPDGATIEILSGLANIVVSDNSVATVVANGQTVALTSGDSVSVGTNASGAPVLTVNAGEVTVTGANGQTSTISAPPGTGNLPPDAATLDTSVQDEETAKDISPVSNPE